MLLAVAPMLMTASPFGLPKVSTPSVAAPVPTLMSNPAALATVHAPVIVSVAVLSSRLALAIPAISVETRSPVDELYVKDDASDSIPTLEPVAVATKTGKHVVSAPSSATLIVVDAVGDSNQLI